MTFADQDDAGQEAHILQLGIKQCKISTTKDQVNESKRRTPETLKVETDLLTREPCLYV